MSELPSTSENNLYLAEHPNAIQDVERARNMAIKSTTERYNATIKRAAGKKMVELYMSDNGFVSKIHDNFVKASNAQDSRSSKKDFATTHEGFVATSAEKAIVETTGKTFKDRTSDGSGFGYGSVTIEELSQDEKRAAIQHVTEQARQFDAQAEEQETRAADLYDEGQVMMARLTPKK